MHNRYEPCNCEHTDHFDDEFGPQTSHDYHFVPSSPHWVAMYVGQVCTECGMGHMSDWLVRIGPHMQDGRFVSRMSDPLTAHELGIMFDD